MSHATESFIHITSDGGQVGRIAWRNAQGRQPGRVRWAAGWYRPPALPPATWLQRVRAAADTLTRGMVAAGASLAQAEAAFRSLGAAMARAGAQPCGRAQSVGRCVGRRP